LIDGADELSWLINKFTPLQQVLMMLNLTIFMLQNVEQRYNV